MTERPPARILSRFPTRYKVIALLLVIFLATFAGVRYKSADAEGASAMPVELSTIQGPAKGETYQWRPVAIGGGGFITGLSMSSNGEGRVARADVYGAYRWSSSLDRWVQLINTDSMPAELMVQDGGNEGVYEIVVAPSEPERMYMAFKGNVYRSDNGGKKFVPIPLTPEAHPIAFDPNSQWRHYGALIVVSPWRPDLVFFGSPVDGFWRSSDAGQHWARVGSVPSVMPPAGGGDQPGNPVWIEPSDDMTKPETVWVMAQGTGMLRSQDAGTNFTPLCAQCTLQPKRLRQGQFTPARSFIGVDDSGKAVWRYRNGTWTQLTQLTPLKSAVYASVAIDMASKQIYLFDEGGAVVRSSDDGDSWVTLQHQSEAGAGDPPWLHVSNQSYFATGQVSFDPAIAHRLWVAAGTGVYYADIDPAGRNLQWISQSRGIEELVANDVIHPPGKAPLFAAWDFGIHVKPDLNVFSSTYGPKERVLIAAQQLDWSVADPAFIVTNASDTRTTCCSEDGDAVLAGYSTNAGHGWSKFATLPQPPGTAADDPWRMSFGTIAVSAGDVRNIVWQPTRNRAPFFTKDQGRNWTRIVFPGETLPNTGSHAVYSYARKTLTADRVKSGVFYLVHSGETTNPQLRGLWRTDTGGESWQKIFSGDIAPSGQYSAKLRAVPGHTGHLFFTAGVAASSDNALRRSIDSGKTWTRLPQVQRVDDIAFGKAAKGSAYPTIFISAQVNGVYGIWRSTNQAASWQSVAGFPVGTLDQVTVVGADPDVFGRVYVGYKGSGWRYGQPAVCTPEKYAFPENTECYGVK